MSIRFKVILPYLLLTLIVAVTGAYVVTRLVSSSLSERLSNQLLEAGRVVSDTMARQEIKHLEAARIVAYTRGLGEALRAGDVDQVTDSGETGRGWIERRESHGVRCRGTRIAPSDQTIQWHDHGCHPAGPCIHIIDCRKTY